MPPGKSKEPTLWVCSWARAAFLARVPVSKGEIRVTPPNRQNLGSSGPVGAGSGFPGIMWACGACFFPAICGPRPGKSCGFSGAGSARREFGRIGRRELSMAGSGSRAPSRAPVASQPVVGFPTASVGKRGGLRQPFGGVSRCGSGACRLHAVMRRQDCGCTQISFTVTTDGRGRG